MDRAFLARGEWGMGRPSLLMLLSLLPAGVFASPPARAPQRAPEASPFEITRAAVRPAMTPIDAGAAFEVQARVLPRSPDPAPYELQARVQTKGAALDCSPDGVFRDGFESP